MRRMSAWWSFSACDRRLKLMISQLGSAWVGVWVTGVSVQWVWAFCSKEEHKEEQIKKKRERKKSREEREKRKKEKREWPVGCDNAWLLGPTISAVLQTCHWVTEYEFWKQLKWVFTFPHYHSFFWVTELWKLSHGIWVTESKQLLFREFHQFWIMSYENRMISLCFVSFQTSSKFCILRKLYSKINK